MRTKTWKSKVFPWAGGGAEADESPQAPTPKVWHRRRRSSLFDMVKHAMGGSRERNELEEKGSRSIRPYLISSRPSAPLRDENSLLPCSKFNDEMLDEKFVCIF